MLVSEQVRVQPMKINENNENLARKMLIQKKKTDTYEMYGKCYIFYVLEFRMHFYFEGLLYALQFYAT